MYFPIKKLITQNHSFFHQKVEVKGAFPQTTQRAQHPPQPNSKFLIENKKGGSLMSYIRLLSKNFK